MTRSTSRFHAGSLPTLLAGAVVILTPILSLLLWQDRTDGGVRPASGPALAIGAGVLTGLALLLSFRPGLLELIRSPMLLIFPVLGWLLIYLSDPSTTRSLGHLLSGALLGVMSATMLVQELVRCNNARTRRARTLITGLMARTDWPVQLSDSIHVSEVHALKICLREDPSPAFVMLIQPNNHVRYVALLAMQDRAHWMRKHAQVVLEVARQVREPVVRAAAVSALGSSRDPRIIDGVSEFVIDPRKEVRHAAVSGLMNHLHRWTQFRQAVRHYLSDPKQVREGPLPLPAGSLPEVVVQDLSLWTSEAGPIGTRSAQTLVEHYRRALSEEVSHAIAEDLTRKVLDPRVPAGVRVEFAQLLRDVSGVPRDALDAMLSGQHPAGVRLLAVESLLARGENASAVATLRELAMVPHRETSLAVASILQNRLRIDMGLPCGGPLPPAKDRLAAEISRRVQEWAAANRLVEKPTAAKKPAAPKHTAQKPAAPLPAAKKTAAPKSETKGIATNRIDGLVFDEHLDESADSGEWNLNDKGFFPPPGGPDARAEIEAGNTPWLM